MCLLVNSGPLKLKDQSSQELLKQGHPHLLLITDTACGHVSRATDSPFASQV